MIFRDYFNCNYMWTAEKIKSLLKKIKSPTVERELFQISNNLELLFVLDYSQFEKVHFLTVGEIIIFTRHGPDLFTNTHYLLIIILLNFFEERVLECAPAGSPSCRPAASPRPGLLMPLSLCPQTQKRKT